jgi:hypothetical protein
MLLVAEGDSQPPSQRVHLAAVVIRIGVPQELRELLFLRVALEAAESFHPSPPKSDRRRIALW